MATLLAAGCSPALTGQAYLLLDSYVYDFALQETTMPTTDPHAPEAAEMISALDPAQHPSLATVMAAAAASDVASIDDDFEAGLELVLDGIARWLAAATTA